MRRLAILAVAAGALACAEAPSRTASVPKPDRGSAAAAPKPGAPVEVRSAVEGDRVRLDLWFASPGRDVAVSLEGTGGLVVSGERQPIRGRSVAAGETLTLEVRVVPGAGHSNLAVIVTGTFGGSPRSRAASVGFGRLERDEVRAFARTDDGRGQPLKVGRGEIR